MGNPIYQYNDFEDEYRDEGMTYESGKDSLILIQIEETDFLTLTLKLGFLILIMVRKESTQILMSIGWKLRFFLLVGNLILNSSWIKFMK